MSDPVTSAVEELLEENVFPPPATASPSSTSSMLTPLITTFLEVLARVEEKVVEYLPPQAQKKFHAVDAWGSTALGLPHSGIIITCLLLLLVLGLSLYFVGIGRARGHKPLPGGKQGRARPSHVVLLGPCGAGKTALYHQLLYNTVPETVTSMVESEGILKDKDIKLVDFPGHERLRGGWKKQFLDAGKVAGVIFVVDAADFSTHKVREAAEFLYDILTHAAMDDGPPLLVACHKSDLPGAKAPARIKALLTSELERLRKTQGGAMMDGNGEEEEDRLPLGRVAVPLNLDVDAPSELTFASTNVAQQTQFGGNDAIEEDIGIGPLMTFISDKIGR